MNLGDNFMAISSDGFPIVESDLERTLSRDRSEADAPKSRKHKDGGGETPAPKKSKSKSRKRSSKSGSSSSSPREEKPQLMASSSRRTIDSCDSFAMLQSRSESINTTATHKTDQTQRMSNLRRKKLDGNSDPLMELPDEDLMDIDRSARTKSTSSSAHSGTTSEALLTASEHQLLEDSRFVRKRSYQPLLESKKKPDLIFSMDSDDHMFPLRPPPRATELSVMTRTGKPKSRSRKITKQKSDISRQTRGAGAVSEGSREFGPTFPVVEVVAASEPVQGLPSRTKKPVTRGGVPHPQANDETATTAATGFSGESAGAGSSRSAKLLMRMLKSQRGPSSSRVDTKLDPFLQEDFTRPVASRNSLAASRRTSLVSSRSKQGVREDLGAFGGLSKGRSRSEGRSPGGLKHVPATSTDQQEKPTYISRFSPETPNPSALMPASLVSSSASKRATGSTSKLTQSVESFQTSITSMETEIPSGEEASSKASSRSSKRMLDEGRPTEGTSGFWTPPKPGGEMGVETSAIKPPETPQGAYGSDRSLADSIDTEDMKDNIKVPGLLDVSGGSRNSFTALDTTRERSNRSNRASSFSEKKFSPSEETLERSNQTRHKPDINRAEADLDPLGEVAGDHDRDPKLSMRGINIETSQRSRSQSESQSAAAIPFRDDTRASPSRHRSPRAKKKPSRIRHRQNSSSDSDPFAAAGDSTFSSDSPQTPRSTENMPQHETPETAPLSATPRSAYPSDWEHPGSTLDYSANMLRSSGLSRKRPPNYVNPGAIAMGSEDFDSIQKRKNASLTLDAPVVVGAMSVSTPAPDLKKNRDTLSLHGIQAAQPVSAAYQVRHQKLEEEEVEYPKTHSKDHSTASGDIELQHNVIPPAGFLGLNTLGKRKAYVVLGIVAFIFAGLVGTIVVLASRQGGGGTGDGEDPTLSTVDPEGSMSLIPTVSPTEGGPALTSSEIEDLILKKTPADQSSIFTDGSPQAAAYAWLNNAGVNQDYYNMPNRLIQRFALASLFYSTNGVAWANSSGWLTKKNECEWFSTVISPDQVCDRENFMTSLDLQVNGLLGSIPSELAVLTRLTLLDLSGNHLYDFLPPLSLAKSLKTLVVDDNEIGNFIHASLGMFTNLETVSLNGNRLAGSIPTELMKLTKLKVLSMTNNFLGGTLPTEIGNLTSLQLLDLKNNDMTGQIPSELSRATSLIDLCLAHNGFEGTLPPELSRLVLMEMLDLSFNNINSDIISEVGFMTNLRTVWLHRNNFFGTIPSQLGLLRYLKWLDISFNTLQGPLPTQLTFLTGLERLHAAENMITGKLPEVLPPEMVLSTVELRANLLSGTIPSQLSSLSVERLDLSLNQQLTGSIPTEVMRTVRYGALIDFTGTSLRGKVACLDEFTDKDGILRVDCDLVECDGECCQCGFGVA